MLLLFPLGGLGGYAQPYEWDWAINGGSDNLDDDNWRYSTEQVYDVVVGSDNNYYFLARIKGSSVGSAGSQLAGQPVKEYNGSVGNNGDIFLFSTTCDGQVRWSQAIGGYEDDRAYNLALDSKNNVYIGATVTLGFHAYAKPQYFYTYFSPTDSISTPGSTRNYREPYLIKYDSNGQYQGKKALNDTIQNSYAGLGPVIYDLYIDSKDTIHFIAGLYYGTYLNGAITVPSQYVYTPHPHYTYHTQYHLIKCDTDLNYVSNMVLPVDPDTGFVGSSFTFKLDEARNRYYIAGFRSVLNVNENRPLTYAGTAFTENAYMLAIDADNGSEIWRREMEMSQIPDDCRIYDLVVDDANGDVYIGGKLFRSAQNGGAVTTIKDPKNSSSTPYTFSLAIVGHIPFIAKLDKDGAVQWARTPSGYTNSIAQTGSYFGLNVALRGGEVAFATNGTNTIWDGFSMNYPSGHKSDPLLMRFSKQTGNVVGMHHIEGSAGQHHLMTAVAVDNDGNYVVGGSYYGNLFTDRPINQWLGYIGKYDFFAAKLAASVCGTAVSTEEFNSLQLNVYPNPTNDVINIETDEQLSNYIIYDVSGRQIQNGNFENNNQINLQNVNNGTYFIKVTTVRGNSGTVKVVKK